MEWEGTRWMAGQETGRHTHWFCWKGRREGTWCLKQTYRLLILSCKDVEDREDSAGERMAALLELGSELSDWGCGRARCPWLGSLQWVHSCHGSTWRGPKALIVSLLMCLDSDKRLNTEQGIKWLIFFPAIAAFCYSFLRWAENGAGSLRIYFWRQTHMHTLQGSNLFINMQALWHISEETRVLFSWLELKDKPKSFWM